MQTMRLEYCSVCFYVNWSPVDALTSFSHIRHASICESKNYANRSSGFRIQHMCPMQHILIENYTMKQKRTKLFPHGNALPAIHTITIFNFVFVDSPKALRQVYACDVASFQNVIEISLCFSHLCLNTSITFYYDCIRTAFRLSYSILLMGSEYQTTPHCAHRRTHGTPFGVSFRLWRLQIVTYCCVEYTICSL